MARNRDSLSSRGVRAAQKEPTTGKTGQPGSSRARPGVGQPQARVLENLGDPLRRACSAGWTEEARPACRPAFAWSVRRYGRWRSNRSTRKEPFRHGILRSSTSGDALTGPFRASERVPGISIFLLTTARQPSSASSEIKEGSFLKLKDVRHIFP